MSSITRRPSRSRQCKVPSKRPATGSARGAFRRLLASIWTPSRPAELPEVQPGSADPLERERQREIDDLKRRWMVALPVGLGLMALMCAPLPMDAMDALMPAILVIATASQFWAGRTFYQAAWASAKHASTNMNTLVALGT